MQASHEYQDGNYGKPQAAKNEGTSRMFPVFPVFGILLIPEGLRARHRLHWMARPGEHS
jgi:hypothetical protein